MGDWKVLPAHLTQQISLLLRRHKIRNVIRVLGPWDVVLSKAHLWSVETAGSKGTRRMTAARRRLPLYVVLL